MAWTTFPTLTDGQVLTGAHMQLVQANFAETAAAKAATAGSLFVTTDTNALAERTPTAASVTTSQTTASTSYTNLTTTGPAVTVDTGAAAIVVINALTSNDTATAQSFAAYEVSGASSITGADSKALVFQSDSANQKARASAIYFEDGLTPGSNTFTVKYRVSAGTGAWANRHLLVIPL